MDNSGMKRSAGSDFRSRSRKPAPQRFSQKTARFLFMRYIRKYMAVMEDSKH